MLARTCLAIAILFLGAASQLATAQTAPDPLAWPEVSQTARPWTRWWWHGSAVDEANITRLLETYQAAGLGGVEITCIYGVRGAEERNLPYLSPEWLAAVRHTLHEAKRLGLGVDLPTGSGWRMGGPSVTNADSNAQLVLRSEALEGGSALQRDYSGPRPQAIVAYGPDGHLMELTDRIEDAGTLQWEVPAGRWTLYTLTQRWSRDSVKRPAPGGEGKNINPFSRRSLDHYLEYFTAKMGDLPAEGIRAQFHDSFEYEGNWCDDFLAEFEKRRGYKLQEHLPALDGKGDAEKIAAVKHDYRETLSDLVLENLIEPWAAWSRAHGMLARNQSHGSPANWLDLYAAVDIPETESFGRLVGGDGHPLLFKFASSAAHVAGRPLVSSETATWLDEHFHVTLGQIKEMVDRQFLAGVNHVVFHGTAYSPADADWPGWVFYASTQLNPQNPIWRDLPALNEYIARCQSILQTTKPDNDILLYWPIHDVWQNERGLRMDFRVHNPREWLLETPFGRTAQWLDSSGYTFDYVSDRQLAECRAAFGSIIAPGGRYSLIVVPQAKLMPLTTMQKLIELTKAGVIVLFVDALPTGPPGVKGLEQRTAWNELVADLVEQLREDDTAEVGGGYMGLVGFDRLTELRELPMLRGERWRAPGGLTFQRHMYPDEQVGYFIRNESDRPFDDWIALPAHFELAVLLDPLSGLAGVGTQRFEPQESGAEQPHFTSLRLQLAPGQTIFVRTTNHRVDGPNWPYRQSAGKATPISGEWSVEFIAGGPELPPAATINELASWTRFAGAAGERFAGTARYTIAFDTPAGAGRYLLDLGNVADSARVELNGKPVATLIAAPFQCDVELMDHNQLVVEVTNVAANRVRDLDRRRVPWRIFDDINIVNINYRPLDASRWPIRDAGLLGTVTIQPLKPVAEE